MAKYVGRQNPPFPLVSDPEEKLYALYGLEAGLGAYLSPMNFGRLGQAMHAHKFRSIPMRRGRRLRLIWK